MKHTKIVLAGLFMVLMIVGLSQPASANDVPPDIWLVIDPEGINVEVSNSFTINIWIKNIPTSYGLMTKFEFGVFWDPALMELTDIVEVGEEEYRPWDTYNSNLPWDGSVECHGEGQGWSTDAVWFTLTFHCIAEGSSTITVADLAGGTWWLGTAYVGPFVPDTITVNRVAPRPVGGVVVPTNTLAILAPYLALAGLIIAVSTVVLVKKRKD